MTSAPKVWIEAYDGTEYIAASDLCRISGSAVHGGEVSVKVGDGSMFPVARLKLEEDLPGTPGRPQENPILTEAKQAAKKLVAAVGVAQHLSEGTAAAMVVSFNADTRAWTIDRHTGN
ncbi:hypothetical protein M707_21995 [Arthrobacter sp. AK-YN10]|nr:hypothetical protein M707_21995 [Arthrobacter sp. AK-YN10]